MRSSVGLPPFFASRREKMPVAQRLVRIGLELHLLHAPHRLHRRRRMHVVEQRRRAGEALVPHQLLGVDAAVGLSKRGVALCAGSLPSV